MIFFVHVHAHVLFIFFFEVTGGLNCYNQYLSKHNFDIVCKQLLQAETIDVVLFLRSL